MPKKKDIMEEAAVEVCEPCGVECKVLPITQEFGNGDLNVLKDKINEIIASR